MSEFKRLTNRRDKQISDCLSQILGQDVNDDSYSWMVAAALVGFETNEDEIFMHRVRTRRVNTADVESGYFENPRNLIRLAENDIAVYSLAVYMEQTYALNRGSDGNIGRFLMKTIGRVFPEFFMLIFKKHHSDLIYIENYFKSNYLLTQMRFFITGAKNQKKDVIRAYSEAIERDINLLNRNIMFVN